VRLTDIIWKMRFREKIMAKHRVATEEVEQVVFGRPYVVRIARGKIGQEDLYEAFGQNGRGKKVL
jgi:hypothetical protein